MEKIFYIVTAPHSKCPPGIVRRCDRRALEGAKIVYNQLKALNLPAVLHLPNVYREIIDMNRPIARYTPYRAKLRQYIRRAQSEGYLPIVLDIHSFPDISESFGNIGDSPPCFVILYMREIEGIIRRLAENGAFAGTRTALIQGGRVNDISMDAISLGAIPFLIEFNEQKGNIEDFAGRFLGALRQTPLKSPRINGVALYRGDLWRAALIIAVIVLLLLIIFHYLNKNRRVNYRIWHIRGKN